MEAQTFVSQDVGPSSTTYPPFRTVTVLGAGTMGAQIAAHLANAGLQVYLLDIAPKEGGKNDIVQAMFKKMTKLKPDPFFTKAAAKRITLGNFDDNFDYVGRADWVIEVVIEKMEIKRQVMARIEAHARPDAVISTNTSGLPIGQIAEGRSLDFKRRFLGTHFFNPPRYLKLLEVIPTDETDPEVLARIAHFGRVHLGKGIVVANDSPYFVGNRIGMYGMLRAIDFLTNRGYSIEEIDALTGPLLGRPKSATFRTADVVGLDVMKHVTENLYEAVPNDESRDVFKVPPILASLVENGALGAKTRAGFYRKEGKVIKSINPASGQYEDPKPINLGDLDMIKRAGDLGSRMRGLYADDGRAGAFFREVSLDLLAYSARRIPEITDSPADLDRAVGWGFGWEMGPFQTWDALGFEAVLGDMQKHGYTVPDWVGTMAANGITSFYREVDGMQQVYIPAQGTYVDDPSPADELSLAAVKTNPETTLWKNADAALLDLGDGVTLFEFRSKANSLGQEVLEGLNKALDKVEGDPNIRGMVIGNEGKDFSVGANLGEVAMAVMMGAFDQIETSISVFQQSVQRIRYAAKPVVVTTHQRVLGGGCEMTIACPNPVLSAETYIGLVELGVGLIPGGSGTMMMAARASEKAPNGHVSEIQSFLMKYFLTIAQAQVATSARQAEEMDFVTDRAEVVMNAERRFHVAKAKVVALSEAGYLPPPVRTHIKVLGTSARATLEAGAYNFLQGGFISEYDYHLASKLAYIMTGGNLTGPAEVHEDYLLDLEREVFLHLLGQQKTQERITHILTTNKPLRN